MAAKNPPKDKPTHAKNADLTPQKTTFADWLCADVREPRTQRELAEVLGVDPATLSDWKRDAHVLERLKQADEKREADWPRAWANLVRIATQTQDNASAVNAIDKMAKLLRKYPSEKVDLRVGKMGLIEWLGSERQEQAIETARPN